MLLIHVFSIFNIKTPRALAALAPLGFLIVKTLTNVLLTINLVISSKLENIIEFSKSALTLLTIRQWMV